MARPAAAIVLAGWILLSSRNPEAPPARWQAVDSFDQEWVCAHVRSGEIDRTAVGEIGGALAAQPADNPLRREAYRRAEERARRQYRCVRE